MTHEDIQKHIVATVLERFDRASPSRQDALQEFMSVTLPSIDNRAAQQLSGMVPTIPDAIYEKWATMFAQRMQETVPQAQLLLLCDGTQENNATLCLVYLMFMESARMEQEIAQDLYALGLESTATDAVGNMLGAYFKHRLDQRNNI